MDPRQPGKVAHSFEELLRQRVFAIALGYPDGNDAQELADDPVHKLLVDRDPIGGDPLASQPTLSRFENSVQRTDLYRMADTLASGLRGAFHGVSPKHLQRYLDEFSYRFDRRWREADLFDLSHAASWAASRFPIGSSWRRERHRQRISYPREVTTTTSAEYTA